MLKLNKCIALLIALVFTITSSPVLACTYENDQEMTQRQKDCSADAARTWSCEVNRCVTTAEAQGIRERYKECAEKVDEAERKKCHDDYAKRESGVKNDEDGANTTLAASAAAINGINAALLFLAGQGKSPGGSCISRKIYMAASVVSVLAELYLMMMVDKKLKELQKDYEDEQVQEEAYSAQIRALQYLKEEQDTIADMAKARKNAYTLQMVLYGATTIAAILEITTGKMPPLFSPTPCMNKEQQEEREKDMKEHENQEMAEQNQELSDANEKMGEQNEQLAKDNKALEAKGDDITPQEQQTLDSNKQTIADNKAAMEQNTTTMSQNGTPADPKATPPTEATGKFKENNDRIAEIDKNQAARRANANQGVENEGSGSGAGSAGADAAKGQATGMLAGYADVLGTSEAIAITSGVSLGFATYLRKAAADQESEAKDNSKKVQEMIDKFTDVMDGSGYCSPDQREDLGNPQCYCYEANGDKNMNRTNSQICQALWAQNTESLMVKAGDYAGKNAVNPKACILVNGQTDRACKCKQMINKTTGENACLKVPLGSNSLGVLGPAMGLPAIQSTVGNLTTGRSSIGTLNGSALDKQVAKIQKIAKPMVDKLNQNRAGQGLGPVNPFDRKFQDGMLKRLKSSGVLSNASAAASPASLAASARPSGGKLATGLNSAEKGAGLSKRSYFGGKGIRSKSRGGKPKDDFAFLNNSGSGGGGKVMGAMEKKGFNYKDNDIVKNKGVSIWKVISNRYRQSGVRRLFDDAKK